MARSYLIYGTKSKQFFPHLQPTQQKTQKIWNLRILRSYRIFWQRKYLLFRTMFCTSIADNYGLMQFCCDVRMMRGFVVVELKNFAECVMILCSFLFSAFVHQNKCHKIFEDYLLMFSPLQLQKSRTLVHVVILVYLRRVRTDSVTASIPLSLTDWLHFTRAWGPVTHCSAADQIAIE